MPDSAGEPEPSMARLYTFWEIHTMRDLQSEPSMARLHR